jgi:hypothetical protein
LELISFFAKAFIPQNFVATMTFHTTVTPPPSHTRHFPSRGLNRKWKRWKQSTGERSTTLSLQGDGCCGDGSRGGGGGGSGQVWC